ncbi:hypothetical protein DSM3645_03323 [Blastopirellula marina DSM 3645]|uniref:Uncharacterized protein n=1 Tax=Blastopirellula marina DSM 3645 TaxID=314230 RepID=A3ZVX8_9BACT|nr:hypothetical protein DSM3645_03323 [Blastopirellula marina DSM 3645]
MATAYSTRALPANIPPKKDRLPYNLLAARRVSRKPLEE